MNLITDYSNTVAVRESAKNAAQEARETAHAAKRAWEAALIAAEEPLRAEQNAIIAMELAKQALLDYKAELEKADKPDSDLLASIETVLSASKTEPEAAPEPSP